MIGPVLNLVVLLQRAHAPAVEPVSALLEHSSRVAGRLLLMDQVVAQ